MPLVRAPRTSWTTRQRLGELGALTMVGVLPALFFYALAPLDPDPHHDGYQFAVAVAIAEGGKPHIDVFSQYGPVSAELFGFVLRLFDPTLLTLRLVTVTLLTMTCVSAYVIARLIGLTPVASVLIVLLWTALSPASGVYSPELQLWPWPSVLFTLIAQALIIATVLACTRCNFSWMWVAIGVLLIFPVFIRVNQGLPLLVVILVGLSLHPQGRRLLRSHARHLAAGLGVGLVLILTYLLLRSDVWLFLRDSIVGPLTAYVFDDQSSSKILTPIDIPQVLLGTYLFGALPILVAASILLVAFGRRLPSWPVTLAVALPIAVLLAATASLGYYGRSRQTLTDAAGFALTEESLNSLGASPFYAAWWVVILSTLIIGLRLMKSKGPSASLAFVLVLFSAAAMTTQVVPRWDVYHLWWAGPVILIAAASLAVQVITPQRREVSVATLVVPFLLVASYSSWNLLNQPRVPIDSGSLAGMRVIPERVDAARSISELGEILPTRSSKILCADGLMAVAGGTYASSGSNFVSWGWSTARPGLTDYGYIVECRDSSMSVADVPQTPPGFEKVAGPRPMGLSPWSQTDFWVFSRLSPQ